MAPSVLITRDHLVGGGGGWSWWYIHTWLWVPAAGAYVVAVNSCRHTYGDGGEGR